MNAVRAMFEARSVAVVGASARPGSFGARMISEVSRGSAAMHLINPRYSDIGGVRCVPSLADIGEPVDLVLLGVGDAALLDQLTAAVAAGARAAVIFGSAFGSGLRDRLGSTARDAGMALCGAGCMGFVNVSAGVRALGYVERDPIPAGPIALVTHSGSVFSAMLRTRRALGYTVAVSSGQELVTTTADYLEYILDHTPSRLVGLVLETVREGPRLRTALTRAAESGVAVVLLPVGASALGASMVAAHSGAVAGDDAMWEALCRATGALRVEDLAELTDTLELLSHVRRSPGGAMATVHDSGAERTLVADIAGRVGVPFADIGEATRARLAAVLDDGLQPENPLDVWGGGSDTRALFRECLAAMSDDPAVAVTALAVDLVSEYDGDTSYADAVLDVASGRSLAVLANLASAIDDATAARLRGAGVPVLEGTRSGLVALRHLLAPSFCATLAPPPDEARRDRWLSRLAEGPVDAIELLRDYGIPTVPVIAAATESQVVAAAAVIGFPAALKTDMPGIDHKSDVGGVHLRIVDEADLRRVYADLSARLGPSVVVAAMAASGVELSLGLVRDPQLGPLVVIAAGGVLVEWLADRVVACPPVTPALAASLLGRLRVSQLLAGYRGQPALDVEAAARAVVAVSALAGEIGDRLDALDINPLIVSETGAVAVDALIVPRR